MSFVTTPQGGNVPRTYLLHEESVTWKILTSSVNAKIWKRLTAVAVAKKKINSGFQFQFQFQGFQFQFHFQFHQFQFQFQFRNWNWNWPAIPIPELNWPQPCLPDFILARALVTIPSVIGGGGPSTGGASGKAPSSHGNSTFKRLL